jgi:hypothetical protein
MRRSLILLAAAAIAVSSVPASDASAQSRRQQQEEDARRQAQKKAEAKKKKDEEWNPKYAPLPGKRNSGPCPFVKVLYDAARYVEFDGGREASAAVGFSGEIEEVRANCSYRDDDPISVDVDVLFQFGKGPRATGDKKTYSYWVAVTERNKTVLAKETFAVEGDFSKSDRVYKTDEVHGITIPRGDNTISGSNYEILVGFDVTPQMAEFNRAGKRFRVNAGQTTAQAAPAPGTQ